MLVPTLTNEINAITASEVETTDCMARSVTRCKDGTMTNPPPTPSSPESTPAKPPMTARRLAQRGVQTKRPLWSRRQGQSSGTVAAAVLLRRASRMLLM